LWLEGNHKLHTTKEIDMVISAEIPHPDLYPKLHLAVSTFMMHGPCGPANLNSACMNGKRCTKYFPKKFIDSTSIDEDGFPVYKRRDNGVCVEKNGTQLDNRYAVPYNPLLLMRYQGHVNTEYCNKSNAIKYLFKYVNKGPDRANLQIKKKAGEQDEEGPIDEIKRYYDCHYVSPCEACWRIFMFDIHEKWPAVLRLALHLEGQQCVRFKENQKLPNVVKFHQSVPTMFLAWFVANQNYSEGRDLTYAEFPSKFTYLPDKRMWHPRKNGFQIGRLSYIPVGSGELYYMRILLTFQKGCKGFDCIKTVNGKLYGSFQDACYALGLLSDDKEFIDGIFEASRSQSGQMLRVLFVRLLIMSTMHKPDNVWKATWKLLADGILYARRRILNIPGIFTLFQLSPTLYVLHSRSYHLC
jgi:hypothetical protein